MTHLSLETCKRLKEAGYPQETHFQYFVYPSGTARLVANERMVPFEAWVDRWGDGGELIARPCSDDLLGELGDSLISLSVLEGMRYRATAYDPETLDWDVFDRLPLDRDGDIPAEALAHLFLAIKARK